MKTKNEKELMEAKKEMIKMIGDMENTGILVVDNSLSVVGNGIDILSCLTHLFKQLQEQTCITKKQLIDAVNISDMTDEELRKEADKKIKEILKKLQENIEE